MSEVNPTVFYRPIPGFPAYRAGDDGSVWSCWKRGGRDKRTGRGTGTCSIGTTWKKLVPHPNVHGRLTVSLCPGRRTHPVHRLILLAFVGPCPDGMECCHNDGNKTNNRLDNLRYGTKKENMADRDKHETTARGERHWGVVLTTEKVNAIRGEYAAGGVTYLQLDAKYGIRKGHTYHIVKRLIWKHLP